MRRSSFDPLLNDGRFSLPSNLLKERGIESSQTIAAARRELGAAGFWEVVETGSLYNAGVFRWSDKWLTYGQKSPADRMSIDPNAKASGHCHYRNIIEYNQSLRAAKASRALSSSLQDQESDSADDEYVQLELFEELTP